MSQVGHAHISVSIHCEQCGWAQMIDFGPLVIYTDDLGMPISVERQMRSAWNAHMAVAHPEPSPVLAGDEEPDYTGDEEW